MKKTPIFTFPAVLLTVLLLFLAAQNTSADEKWEKHAASARASEGLAAYFTGDDFLESGDPAPDKMIWCGKTLGRADSRVRRISFRLTIRGSKCRPSNFLRRKTKTESPSVALFPSKYVSVPAVREPNWAAAVRKTE